MWSATQMIPLDSLINFFCLFIVHMVYSKAYNNWTSLHAIGCTTESVLELEIFWNNVVLFQLTTL